MNHTPTTTRTLKLAILAAVAALLLAGCEALLDGFGGGVELTALQRVNAFISDVNESPQSTAELKSHFHPASETYSAIDEEFWDLTVFDEQFGPFEFGTSNVTGSDPNYDNSTVVTVSFESSVDDAPRDITFVLIPEDALSENMLIREIDAGPDDLYQNFR